MAVEEGSAETRYKAASVVSIDVASTSASQDEPDTARIDMLPGHVNTDQPLHGSGNGETDAVVEEAPVEEASAAASPREILTDLQSIGISETDAVAEEMPAVAGDHMSNEVTLTFTPGDLGLVFADHGIVLDTLPGSQAQVVGVQRGWIIVRIGGAPVDAGFTKEAISSMLELAQSTTHEYVMTFRKLIVPAYRPPPSERPSEVCAWKVVTVFRGGANVREFKDLSSQSLGVRAQEAIVHGRQDGDWVKLEEEPGYILIQSAKQGVILQRMENQLGIPQGLGSHGTQLQDKMGDDSSAFKFAQHVAEEIRDLIDSEKQPEIRHILRRSVGWETTERNREIEVDFLTSFLARKDQENKNCISFIGNLLLMSVFVSAMLTFGDLASTSLLQREVHGMLTGTTFEGVERAPTFSGHKIFQDIDTKEDFYLYLKEAVLPLFLLSKNVNVSHPSELTRSLRYNRLIGGIEMQQKRRKKKSCSEVWPDERLVDQFVCYPDMELSDMTDDCFGLLENTVRRAGERFSLPSGFCADESLEGMHDLSNQSTVTIQGGSSSGIGGRLLQASVDDAPTIWNWLESWSPLPYFSSGAEADLANRLFWYSSSWWSAAAPGPEDPQEEQAWKNKLKVSNTVPKTRHQKTKEASKKRWQRPTWGRHKQSSDIDTARFDSEARRLRVARRRDPTETPVSLDLYTGLRYHEKALAYTVLLNSGAGLEAALERVKWLQHNNWIDLQTQWVGVRVFLLNPELSTFASATMNIYFSSGGEVAQLVDAHAFKASPYSDKLVVALNVIFASLIFGNLIGFWMTVRRSIIDRSVNHKLLDIVFWLHFCTGHGGMTILLFQFITYLSLGAVENQILELGTCGNRTVILENTTTYANMYAWPDPLPLAENVGGMTPDDRIYTDCVRHLHEAVKDHALVMKIYYVYLSLFTLFLILRFFRVFSMQPKLAMMVNTLIRSWDQVLHHLIVFATIMVAYAIAGVLIFGRKDPNFTTVWMAISACFAVMLGNFDSKEKSEDNPLTTFLWFNTFTILVGILMLNCLMAIVMDVYVTVKASVTSVQPMWTHTVGGLMDAWNARGHVHVQEIIRAIKTHIPLDSDVRIDKDILANLIPGMSEQQADDLVSEAIQSMKKTEDNEGSLTDMTSVFGHISVTTKRIILQLDELSTVMGGEKNRFKDLVEDLVHMEQLRQRPEASDCQVFEDRALGIEERLTKLEHLLEDCACWNAYRMVQMHEQFGRIQEKLEEHNRFLHGQRGNVLQVENSPASEPPPPALLQLRDARNFIFFS